MPDNSIFIHYYHCIFIYIVVWLHLVLQYFSNDRSPSLRKMCLFSKLFWSVCSRIWTEYGESCITLYSVRMRENTDQNNSQFEHFSRSACVAILKKELTLCSGTATIGNSPWNNKWPISISNKSHFPNLVSNWKQLWNKYRFKHLEILNVWKIQMFLGLSDVFSVSYLKQRRKDAEIPIKEKNFHWRQI